MTLAISREELAERVRRLRQRRGWSQHDLAARIGISRAALSAIETRQRKIDSLELAAFANAFEIPTAMLLDDEDLYGTAEVATALRALGPSERAEALRYIAYLSRIDKRGDHGE